MTDDERHGFGIPINPTEHGIPLLIVVVTDTGSVTVPLPPFEVLSFDAQLVGLPLIVAELHAAAAALQARADVIREARDIVDTAAKEKP